MEGQPKHSHLGASGAERWLNCPGSVSLIKGLTLPETTDEPDYQKEGTALHAVTAALLENGEDAWEVAGTIVEGVEVTPEMAEAVQTCLDVCRPMTANPIAKPMIEHRISSPIHPAFFGTVDFAVLSCESLLQVVDFKFGKGVVVEVENNPQIMYYAYGILQMFPQVRRVVLRIVQPRAFHPDGPVRRWETTADEIHMWVAETLLPGMRRAESDKTLDAGDWCRFCPAKLVCPMLTGFFETACTYDPKRIVSHNAIALGQAYKASKAVRMYLKAIEDETLRRLTSGQDVPGTKLVYKRANRVWKDGADQVIKSKFGDDAMTPPCLKSPNEIEKISDAAKKVVTELAYTPESGLTVALDDDNRPAVKRQSASEVFSVALKGAKA